MRRYLSRACLAAVILALSAVSYSYSSFGKWATVPVTFFINPANLDVTPAAAVTALRSGMDQWNNAGSSFSFEYGGAVSDTATALDGRNVVFFRNASSGSAIATTYSWWNGNGELQDSDIIFWDGPFTFFTGTSGCGGSNGAYIEDIATHEFGHALGLNHSTIASATMYPSYSLCSQQFRTLSQDDLDGVRSLYPGATNTAPTVTLTSPANGASIVQSTVISFTATASDTQDGNLTSQIQWTDNGASIGSGGSFSLALTTLGSHVIEARVTDSGGLQAASQVTITITPPGGGSGTLTATPGLASGGVHRVALTWSGLAGTYVDIYRNGVRAYSSSNGGSQLDYPGSQVPTAVTYTYKVCTYTTSTCTNTVSVSYGSPSNTPPTVSITSPANGASVVQGATISLTATASDTQDGNLTGQIQWTDNGAPAGSGGTVSRTLTTLGSHVIVATVTDSGGLQGSSQVSVTVTAPANTPPTVSITSPANGASVLQGATVSLIATASDTQDGNLTGQIQWTDNGTPAGSGGTVSRTLTTLGAHLIVATVTDSGGLQASSQITVVVTASDATGTLSATAGLAGGGIHRVTLTWSGVTGVYVDIYRNGVRAYSSSNGGSKLDYPGTQVPTAVTYTYKVCTYATSTCTNTVSVSY